MAAHPSPLEDIVAAGLDVLFVGFNPGIRSGETGNHYAGPNNHFWRLLAASGITPRQLSPAEGRSLIDFGVGSTNLVGRATPGSGDLTRAELRSGVPRLAALLQVVRPRIVAYTGKGVYLAAAGRSEAPWGLQEVALFPPALDVVLPSPSGRVVMKFDEKLVHYRFLKELLEELGRLP